MKQTLLSFLFVLGIGIGTSQAQVAGGMFGIALEIGVPTNEFAENTNSVGAGITISGLKSFAPGVPVYLGVEIGYMNYGRNVNQVNTSLLVLNTNIPLRFDVETNNNMLNGHAILRFVAPIPNIQLYGDVLVGGRYIYTRTKVINTSPESNLINTQNIDTEQINARTNVRDWIFSYGAGGGIMIGSGPIKLDIRVVYLLGSEAEYLDREGVEEASVNNPPTITNQNNIEFNQNSFPTKNSSTDMFFIKAGVKFAF